MFCDVVGEHKRQVGHAPLHFPYFFLCVQLTSMKLWNRIMERTEAITILENDRCRKIYAMQHRPQIFFQKDNVCAGKTNLENIKIVSTILVGEDCCGNSLFQLCNRKPTELH